MRFVTTPLHGLLVVEVEVGLDARGGFGRCFCKNEFATAGVTFDVAQASISSNLLAGTLRGMHYQADPHGEAKLVRCTRGRLFDVAVDLRPNSPTRTRWFGLELSAATPRLLYIPPGFAHGFVTREPDCEVSYLMDSEYFADAARGVRWNDPAFGIAWPTGPREMSEKDASYPDYLG
jgi:dTDP-4-dehydrorhamnose 3,5-epimerase